MKKHECKNILSYVYHEYTQTHLECQISLIQHSYIWKALLLCKKWLPMICMHVKKWNEKWIGELY